MRANLTERLPYATQLLAAYRPLGALPDYAPRTQLAFELYADKPVCDAFVTRPTPLACMENWLQMGLPHPIPEEVMQAIVRHNTDERTALRLLARLTCLVIKGLGYVYTLGKTQASFLLYIDERIALAPAFTCHWAWLCQAFAPHLADAVSLTCVNALHACENVEVDFALFLTNQCAFPPYLNEWLEYTKTATCRLAACTATTLTAQRYFTPISWHESTLAYGHLLTSYNTDSLPSPPDTQRLLQDKWLCHQPLSALLPYFLYASTALGHQTLIVVPHEVALRATKHTLRSLGIDAICAISAATPSAQWMDKWTSIINRQRTIVLCAVEQLLHPFWQACAQQWQPDHILYTSAEHLSPWYTPTAMLYTAYWERLMHLFPESHYLLQSDTLTHEDMESLKAFAPFTNAWGTCVSHQSEWPHERAAVRLVLPNAATPTFAYQQAKQQQLEACLTHDNPKRFALLCPHTKGHIGVADGVYMGMARRMQLRYDKPYHKPICSIAGQEQIALFSAYLYGQTQGIVAFMPLANDVLDKATTIYALGLPNTWAELRAIQQRDVPTTFILAASREEEANTLRFRLHGCFSSVAREFTLAMLLLKAIVTQATLSLAYPSPLSKALDDALEKLGETRIAHHRSEVDKPKRYQQVVLQALATLQATQCIDSFSYCLDQGTLEAQASQMVDTYKLKAYITHRYEVYYPHFLAQIEQLVSHIYAHSPTTEASTTPQSQTATHWLSTLWHWLVNTLKG